MNPKINGFLWICATQNSSVFYGSLQQNFSMDPNNFKSEERGKQILVTETKLAVNV